MRRSTRTPSSRFYNDSIVKRGLDIRSSGVLLDAVQWKLVEEFGITRTDIARVEQQWDRGKHSKRVSTRQLPIILKDIPKCQLESIAFHGNQIITFQ